MLWFDVEIGGMPKGYRRGTLWCINLYFALRDSRVARLGAGFAGVEKLARERAFVATTTFAILR